VISLSLGNTELERQDKEVTHSRDCIHQHGVLGCWLAGPVGGGMNELGREICMEAVLLGP
jgi:hypothetical protein